MPDLSKPLEELPTFLATISMVTDDEREIVKGLTQSERKSPPRYDPARQIFLRILTGDLTYDFGLAQALKLSDPIERDCAVSILRAASRFLSTQPAARLETLPAMTATLPNGLDLRVGPCGYDMLTKRGFSCSTSGKPRSHPGSLVQRRRFYVLRCSQIGRSTPRWRLILSLWRFLSVLRHGSSKTSAGSSWLRLTEWSCLSSPNS